MVGLELDSKFLADRKAEVKGLHTGIVPQPSHSGLRSNKIAGASSLCR